MTLKLRVWLARKILGKYCACYKTGYHQLCDFRKHKIGNKNVTKI
jgi:hypothetical protein